VIAEQGEVMTQRLTRPARSRRPADTKVREIGLGLMQKSRFREIEKIARIRNIFAHRLFSATFKDREIKPMCDPLDMDGQDVKGARTRFIHAVSITAMKLLLLGLEVKQAEKKKETEYPTLRPSEE
jgi:hypothetical protein